MAVAAGPHGTPTLRESHSERIESRPACEFACRSCGACIKVIAVVFFHRLLFARIV